MAAKGKRNRNWKSNKKAEALPALENMGESELKNLAQWLYQWTEDMNSWGQDIRDDIIRLEGAAGFAAGDPGDPPDGPPPDKRK